jgi:Zn-dependent protease/predicted transcriptional regulator
MRSYTVTSVWDIPIRINVSLIVFLPILAYLIGSGGQIELYAGVIESLTGRGFDLGTLRSGRMPWVIGITAATGLFVSVTLHELGHSWVALRYDLEIESITLWILGGLAALSEIPREWNREFWIAIAGPITSVLVGGVCYAAVLAIPESSQVIRFVVGWLAIVNVTLAVFNLLPAFPMDGGRILRAILARSRPYASATRIAGRIGVVFAVLFAVFGVLNFNPIFLLLAWFIYGAATTESRTVLLDELLHDITVGDIMSRDPRTVEADTTLREFADRMVRDRRTVYPVTDGGEVVGAVSLADLGGQRNVDRESATVRSVMREVPRIDAGADAFDTLAAHGGRGGLLALVTEDGAVAGVLSDSDYSHALTIQRGFRSGISG